MEIRPLLDKKKPFKLTQRAMIRLMIGIVGFIIGVYITIKLIA